MNDHSSSLEGRRTVIATTTPIAAVVLSLCLLIGSTGIAHAIEVGDKAPDFELDSTTGGKLKLSSLKGKNVLINFYVLDFSPT